MFLTSPDYLSCTGLVWVSQGNLLTICSCTDRAIHNTRRLTAVCKHAKSPGSFVNISRVIIKCIRTFESRELESAACWCTFGRRFRGTHDYSLFFIYLFIYFVSSHRLPDGQFTKVKCQHHLQENEQNSPPGAKQNRRAAIFGLLQLYCASFCKMHPIWSLYLNHCQSISLFREHL